MNERTAEQNPAVPDCAGAVPPALMPGWSQTFRALRHRNFRLFITGQVISLTGTWMQNVAQAWLVYRLTRSEFILGLAMFATYLPVFVLSPVGGLAADRYSRHRIVIATQTLAMVQALLLAALTMTGAIQIWHVLALAFCLGCVNAFDMPARQSLVIHLASKQDLLSAISLNSAVFNLARVVGPAVAGILVAGFGEGPCFLVNGMSFAPVIGCLAVMRISEVDRQRLQSPWAHLVEGFRYAHGNGPVRTFLGFSGTVNLSAAPGMVLAPVFADAIFHRGSLGLGFLTTAMGLGAVAGTLGLARRTRVSGLPDVIVMSAALMAAGMALFAWAPSFYLALAVMPLIGFNIMRQNASTNTLLQTVIADDYRGRIMALYSMMVVGMMPLGSLVTGALAEHYGARWTMFGASLLGLTGAAVLRMKLAGIKAWMQAGKIE